MEVFEAIQIQALKSVVQPDDGYFMRRVFRWYSEKFHTPLHLVDDLPIDEVLTAYFEVIFEKMDPRERNKYVKLLTMSDEERQKKEKVKKKRVRKPRKKKEVATDDEFLKMVSEKAIKEEVVHAERRKIKDAEVQKTLDELGDRDPLEFDLKF